MKKKNIIQRGYNSMAQNCICIYMQEIDNRKLTSPFNRIWDNINIQLQRSGHCKMNSQLISTMRCNVAIFSVSNLLSSSVPILIASI